MYFRFNYVTVFACIFVTIIVSVNGMDVFSLTDISVTVIVNGKNTALKASRGCILIVMGEFRQLVILNTTNTIALYQLYTYSRQPLCQYFFSQLITLK